MIIKKDESFEISRVNVLYWRTMPYLQNDYQERQTFVISRVNVLYWRTVTYLQNDYQERRNICDIPSECSILTYHAVSAEWLSRKTKHLWYPEWMFYTDVQCRNCRMIIKKDETFVISRVNVLYWRTMPHLQNDYQERRNICDISSECSILTYSALSAEWLSRKTKHLW